MTMSGTELKAIRRQLGLSLDEFAVELGYDGSPKNNRTTMRRFENGERPISPPVGRLAYMFSVFGLPDSWPQHLEAEPVQEQTA